MKQWGMPVSPGETWALSMKNLSMVIKPRGFKEIGCETNYFDLDIPGWENRELDSIIFSKLESKFMNKLRDICANGLKTCDTNEFLVLLEVLFMFRHPVMREQAIRYHIDSRKELFRTASWSDPIWIDMATESARQANSSEPHAAALRNDMTNQGINWNTVNKDHVEFMRKSLTNTDPAAAKGVEAGLTPSKDALLVSMFGDYMRGLLPSKPISSQLQSRHWYVLSAAKNMSFIASDTPFVLITDPELTPLHNHLVSDFWIFTLSPTKILVGLKNSKPSWRIKKILSEYDTRACWAFSKLAADMFGEWIFHYDKNVMTLFQELEQQQIIS